MNCQPQVIMTAKAKASSVRREAATLASTLGNEPVAKRGTVAPLRTTLKTTAVVAEPDSKLASVASAYDCGSPGHVYLFTKRTFDLVFGAILLVIAVPVISLAAVAIRLDTPGSPFFFQTRLGRNGKPFKIFKLRGMYLDARKRFPAYYDYSAKRDLEFCFHHEHDPRVTPAGKFIRKTSIDELPNLWNVVLGDMSLVGPRPEIPDVLALYGPYREQYLSVKPGITCLSKCTGRDRLTKRETIEFDLNYVRNRSFGADLKILWRTFKGVVLRRDVF